VGAVLINILPMIVGSAVVPAWILINIILLMGPNGVARSTALILGVSLTRLLQGLLVGYFVGNVAVSANESGPSPIASTLFVITGLLFAIGGVKAYLDHPDADDPPPKWMAMIDSLTPVKIFLLAAAWVLIGIKLWMFTLSALKVIAEAGLSSAENAIVYLIYTVGCVIFFLVPLLFFLVAPEPAKAALARMRAWIEDHNRVIVIILSAVFAAVFLYKGLTGWFG
jgi:hypothetical protein